MIDAKTIRQYECDLIDEQAEAIHAKAEADRSAHLEEWMANEATRVSNMEVIEKAKTKAEETFPQVLKTVEDKIMSTIRAKKSSCMIECPDTYTGMYTQIFLVQALTVGGFICRLKGASVLISW